MLRDDIEVNKARQKLVQEMTVETALDLWQCKFESPVVFLCTMNHERDAFWFDICRKLIYAGKAKRRIYGSIHEFRLKEAVK